MSSIRPVDSTYRTYTESIVFFIYLNFWSESAFFPILVLTCTPSYLKNINKGFKLTGKVISIFSKIVSYLMSSVSLSLGQKGFLTYLDKGKIGAGFPDNFEVFAPYPNTGKFEMF